MSINLERARNFISCVGALLILVGCISIFAQVIGSAFAPEVRWPIRVLMAGFLFFTMAKLMGWALARFPFDAP